MGEANYKTWTGRVNHLMRQGGGPLQLASLLCVVRSYSFEMESETSNRQGEDNREVKSKNTLKMRTSLLFFYHTGSGLRGGHCDSPEVT